MVYAKSHSVYSESYSVVAHAQLMHSSCTASENCSNPHLGGSLTLYTECTQCTVSHTQW